MSLHDHLALLGAALDDGLIDRERAAHLLVEHAKVQLSFSEALDRIDAYRGLPTGRDALFAGVESLLNALDAVKHATTPQATAEAQLLLETELALQQEHSFQRARAGAWDMLRRPIRTRKE